MRCRRLPWRGRIRCAGRDALDEAHQLDVEERHAQLEAGRHRHLVVADQDAVGQEHARVEVERLLEQVAPGHVAEHRARRRSRSSWASSPLAAQQRPRAPARR